MPFYSPENSRPPYLDTPMELLDDCPRAHSRGSGRGDGMPCSRFTGWMCNSTVTGGRDNYCNGRAIAIPENRPQTRTSTRADSSIFETSQVSFGTEASAEVPGSFFGELYNTFMAGLKKSKDEEEPPPPSFKDQCYCRRCGSKDVKVLRMREVASRNEYLKKTNVDDVVTISCPHCHREGRRTDPGVSEFWYKK